MYLIAVWVSSTSPELTRDRVIRAFDQHLPEAGLAHVFLRERKDWLIIGLFLNGPPPLDSHAGVERIRSAVAGLLPTGGSVTIMAELMPLELIAGVKNPDQWDG